jgi:type III secretion system YscI/HrpB-like protein
MEIAASAIGNSAISGQGAAAKPDALPKQASADDVSQFQSARAGPGQPATATGTPEGSITANGLQNMAAPSQRSSSPGDAILQGLQRMSNDFSQKSGEISKTLESVKPGESLSASDMLRMQYAMTEVSMQQDMAAKVVGKVTQSLDTLLKAQ